MIVFLNHTSIILVLLFLRKFFFSSVIDRILFMEMKLTIGWTHQLFPNAFRLSLEHVCLKAGAVTLHLQSIF
jgi:hypothetical protein